MACYLRFVLECWLMQRETKVFWRRKILLVPVPTHWCLQYTRFPYLLFIFWDWFWIFWVGRGFSLVFEPWYWTLWHFGVWYNRFDFLYWWQGMKCVCTFLHFDFILQVISWLFRVIFSVCWATVWGKIFNLRVDLTPLEPKEYIPKFKVKISEHHSTKSPFEQVKFEILL